MGDVRGCNRVGGHQQGASQTPTCQPHGGARAGENSSLERSLMMEQQQLAEAELSTKRKRRREVLDLTLGGNRERMTYERRQNQRMTQEWRKQQPDLLDGGQGKQQRKIGGQRARARREIRRPKKQLMKVRVVGMTRRLACEGTRQRGQSRRGIVVRHGAAGGRVGISQQSALTPTGSILASKAQNDATCSVQMTSHACSSLGLEAPGGDCGERGAPPERPAGVGNGLEQPQLLSGEVVTGLTKEKHRLENKRNRKQKQAEQGEVEYMTQHQGNFKIPPAKDGPAVYRGSMCPSGLALYHEAAETLLEYATGGCPVETGRDWTVEMMAAAIERGPHVSAMDPEAMKILAEEVAQKELKGQCRVIKWEDIKKRPPTQLKVSPIAMIPHKSRKFRAILDLSFSLRLENGESIPAVNESSVKTAPKGAIDQLGFSLQRIIHAFAHTNPNDKVFMAKWDIKDGFWRLDAQKDEEWNFAYVLPQEEGKPIKLVIPTSLQMGWIESPPYFCAASETGRDVAVDYVETEIGSLPAHKFLKYSAAGSDFGSLPRRDKNGKLRYLVECYVDDYIALAIPTSQQQLEHVANAVTMGIHDVFPPDDNDEEDAISLKKLKKFEAMWLLHKDILGFTFDGLEKTIWLEKPKRDALLEMLRMWIRKASKGKEGILFVEFQSVISKLRHAFVSIPNGRGLLTPCNQVLRGEPKYIFLHRNDKLLTAIKDCRTLLRESTLAPTKCYELVSKWPDFVGVKDASGHGVGGVIIGENMACIPTVFRFEWPADIKADLNSEHNPKGKITNSDLEMAGLLLLWLIMDWCATSSQGRTLRYSAITNPLCLGCNGWHRRVMGWQES